MVWSKIALETFARAWAADLGLADRPDVVRDTVGFFRHADREMRELRRKLLERLANLSLESRALQRTVESFEPLTLDQLGHARTALRLIWPREVPIPGKQQVVDLLLAAATKSPDRIGLFAPLAFGHVEFGAKNFPGQLLIAILENWPHMVVCGNPDCPAPYFFAKRSTQKYCERGECTRYAVRKKALNWWTNKRAKTSKPKGKGRQ
jgi:hypothetical protein